MSKYHYFSKLGLNFHGKNLCKKIKTYPTSICVDLPCPPGNLATSFFQKCKMLNKLFQTMQIYFTCFNFLI